MLFRSPNLQKASLESWATFPPEVNVLHSKNYLELTGQVSNFLADLCPDLQCREDSSEATMTDYIGCQSQTVSSKTCQKWTDQSPQEHSYLPDWFPEGHLGDHNFCRNPDGDSTIWCLTTDPTMRWDYCTVRSSSEVPAYLTEEPVGTSLEILPEIR